MQTTADVASAVNKEIFATFLIVICSGRLIRTLFN
jgi:hypothetical protein